MHDGRGSQNSTSAHPLRDYAVVTGCYWVFTLTDGALRTLVLLHLHQLGYGALEIASMFLFYELFGIVTNFAGGRIGARYGLRATLFAGLATQIGACTWLAARGATLGVGVLLATQAASGIAKDLTKMSSKSYIKLVVPTRDQRGLMRWVALLTGSKNALKGVGFFLGGLLLSAIGFQLTCVVLATSLAVALLVALFLLPPAAGKAQRKERTRRLLSDDPRINWLAATRLFLFGSRDLWFTVGLPIFLAAALNWSPPQVAGLLAVWVIGYGMVQAAAPSFLRVHAAARAKHLASWTAALLVPLACILIALQAELRPVASLLVGLAVFGVVFAACSALHSYLIVAYSDQDRVALNVGFYYAANAAGRFVGTALSGFLFQVSGGGAAGLSACLVGSIAFVSLATGLCAPLRRAEAAPGRGADAQLPVSQ